MFNEYLAEIAPLVGGPLPGTPGPIEEAFFLDRFGVIHLRLCRAGIEISRALSAETLAALVDPIDGSLVPLFGYKPVVAFFHRPIRRMEIVVVFKELAVLHVLIGAANLLADEPAEIPEQLRVAGVVAFAFLQELNAAAHVVIAVAVVVEFNGDVVAQVPGLEFPKRHEVRLQLGELLERRGKTSPVFSLLEVVGLFPQPVHRNAAKTQRRKFNGFAGRVDFTDIYR